MHDTSTQEIRTITLFSVLAILLILLISISSQYANFQMYTISKKIYMHPLNVSNAALDINLNIVRIHRDMKDVVLSSSDKEIIALLEDIKKHETKVYKDFKIIDEKILAEEGHKLLNDVREQFQAWVPIRQEVIRLVYNNQLQKAIYITKNRGANHVKMLTQATRKLNTYARNKAGGFIKKSENTFKNIEFLSIGFILASLLLIIYYAFYLRYKIAMYINLAKNKENALHNSKSSLELIFNTLPTILLQTDGENITKANSTMLSFFGYTSLEDFTKEHDCICDYFLNQENMLQAEMGEKNWIEYLEDSQDSINKVAMRKDGVIHYFTVDFQKISETQRLVAFTDITEMEYLNKRLTIALNATKDGLWGWNLQTGELYFSSEWKKQLGYEENELENALQTWEELIHPDDKEATERDYKANLNGETEFYENTHRLRHKDGSWVWILDRAQTEFNVNGEAIRMVGTHTDITELKELELELREAKQQFDLFMLHLPYLALIKDDLNRVIYVNPQVNAIFDKSIIGMDATECIGGEDGNKVLQLSNKARDEGKQEEVLELTINEKEYIFRTLAFPIPQNSGEVYVGILYIDITESYITQEELRNQEEIMIAQSRHAAMGEMISMIAHQWRQPISVIAMGANNLLADIELESISNENIIEESNRVLKQTDYLSKTIDDFRDFFRPGKDTEEIDIEDVMQEALKIIGKSLENNNISFSLKLDDTPKIQTYSRELLQVYINILKNSKEALTEYQDKERKIDISITHEADNIITTICDNGGGIKEPILLQIFNPYFTTKGSKSGTGLGLYMSKIIIEKHLFGTLDVYNSEQGACFKITIPLLK